MEAMRESLAVGRSFWERLRAADPGLMAAAVAYNVFFALVPLSVAFLTGASLIGQDAGALSRVEDTLRRVLVPDEVISFIVDDVLAGAADVVSSQEGLIIGISVVIALWSASRAVTALLKALARIEGMTESRSGLKVRAVAVALTLAAGVAFAIASVSLLLGRQFFEFLDELANTTWIVDVWLWLRIPVAGFSLYAFLWAVYHFGPPRPFPASWLAALVSAVLATSVSIAFGLYLGQVGELGSYGLLGTFAVALLWIYLGAYVILFSAAAVGFGWGRWRNPPVS
ncbi:MAG: YihY/virulence factor BrkB family protein [Acidimicrobiia bacterium]|nr:YihY/virulence factor BrkB family protein [Acidimicrobiia bacterium]